MIWTSKQQGIYRGLVKRAWAKESADHPAFFDKKAKESWYRRTLHRELGVWTTKQLGQDHFAAACAVFERIVGESFYWTERSLGGTAAERKRRVAHLIGEQCTLGELDSDFAAGVARKAIGKTPPPVLTQLDLADLLKILDALKEIVRRQTPEHDATEPSEAELDAAGVSEGDPF